jgi:hypothetical protein
MPRHRKERVTRHRAGRRNDTSPRHAQFSAAPTKARPAADEPAGNGPTGGESLAAANAPRAGDATAARTVPLSRAAAWSPGQADRAGSRPVARHGQGYLRDAAPRPSADPRQQQRLVIRGTAHGLLVTPWFAAGAACVIAAALWLSAPHTSFKLSDPTNSEPCASAHCAPGADGGGTTATKSGKSFGNGAQAAGSTAAAGSHKKLTGVTVSYDVVWHAHGKFTAVITITSKHELGRWRLSFRIPGTKVKSVVGARWKPSARRDGGTAWPLPVSHSAARGAGREGGPSVSDSTSQSGGGSADHAAGDAQGGSARSYKAWFVIEGVGSPARAVDCTYNGESCTFG